MTGADKLSQLTTKIGDILDLADTEKRALTDEEIINLEKLEAEAEGIKKELEASKKVDGLRQRQKARKTLLNISQGRQTTDTLTNPNDQELPILPKEGAPVYSRLRAFQGPKAEENAYLSGMWAKAVLFDDPQAQLWCKQHDVEILAQSEGDNIKGGYLAPTPLLQAIINLREKYGVARQHGRVIPMGSDSVLVPRRTGGLTAYFIGENNEATESEKSWDNVGLTAKKMAVLCKYSTELEEDAIINMADDLAMEVAQAFAKKEDQCIFAGAGTSTYGGISGVTVKVNDGNHAGSIKTATSGDTSFGELILLDLEELVGMLPEYAHENAKFFISRQGFTASMQRLMDAAGGNTMDQLADGPRRQFLGYPAVFSSTLNKTLSAQASTILFFFGDMRQAVTIGDRRNMTLKQSDQRYFESDQIGILGTQRFTAVCHELGDDSNAGSLVAFKTPSS